VAKIREFIASIEGTFDATDDPVTSPQKLSNHTNHNDRQVYSIKTSLHTRTPGKVDQGLK